MAALAPLLSVVNDDAPSLYLLCRHLRGGGYRVLEAQTGAEAVELATRERPVLVVLNVLLPDVVGYEIARRLRADCVTARAGVVYVSASYEVAEVERFGDNRGEAYMAQPVDGDELLTTVRLVLTSRGTE